MLVLSRRPHEKVVFNLAPLIKAAAEAVERGENVTDAMLSFLNDQTEISLTVLEFRGSTVRIGVEAPRDIPVHRGEVAERINAENPLHFRAGDRVKVVLPVRNDLILDEEHEVSWASDDGFLVMIPGRQIAYQSVRFALVEEAGN